MEQANFDYDLAFSRNIGWVTEEEQHELRNKTIAIAGMGGVGGAHLMTLARLGIGHFHLSDYDSFEVENFNRQAGAKMSSIGQPKLSTLVQMAKDINPELTVKEFPEGINEKNAHEFVKGIDLYVDSLDFFALEARRLVFAECYERNIPATTAAPLGMGTAVLNFMPGKMTFEEYFKLEGCSEEDQALKFLVGLSPAMLQRPYLMDKKRVNLNNKKGPSTIMGCDLCAGVAATNVLKILLHRGPILAAPWGLHFDAYRNKLKITYRPGGNDNMIQKGMIWFIKNVILKHQQQL
ncbi:ThiF family adenylyltransferase [Spartinivicinus ruber]|uniref:ThiF family adenylyltransferase n=1 Tax=Spartinivicinus ruber TaxID=2683272 RepID=UPI0013D4FD46|nr:ThiF family adenylyltransferase [Spartinivicinus ruber]